jgi:hypothetical protein
MYFGNWKRQHKMNFFISINLFMMFLLSIICSTSGNSLPTTIIDEQIVTINQHYYRRPKRRIFNIPSKCPRGMEFIAKRCREILRE